jgi:multidrug efflux system outer membrane protein
MQIATTENQLNVLLGRNPGPILRSSLSGLPPSAPEIPAGLPAALLRRRPDVLEAEQMVVAANAGIGSSLADFFPRIGLTTLMGRASPELSSFTSTAGNLWSVGGSVTGPLFEGGALRAQYRSSKAQFQEALAAYRQSVLVAFQEVSDALVTREKLGEMGALDRQAITVLTSAVELATARYLNGKSSYDEVLQAQQQLYPALVALARTQAGERIALVQLYKALGGGWTEDKKINAER